MILAAALLLDASLGEPPWLWSRLRHPAVVMGDAVAALDLRLNIGRHRRAKGVAAVALLAGGAWLFGWLIAWIPDGGLLELVAAAILLAQRSLVDHVAAVAGALRRSLPEGRAAVAMIVGRDTAAMARHGTLVGGTTLFRLHDVGDAAAFQARLAEHRVWSRIFPYSTRWVRLGLPHPDRWPQLEAALR